jgi:hypothetical protein
MSRFLISANRLSDGLVVFYTAEGTWSEAVSDAVLYDEENPPQLAVAAKDVLEIVGAYTVEVEQSENGLRPLRVRERIRLSGPTIEVKRSA